MKAQRQMKKVVAIACVALGIAAVAAPKVTIDKIENTDVWSTKKVTYTVSGVPADAASLTYYALAFDVTAYGVTTKINKGTAADGTFTETLETAAYFGEARKDPNAKIRVSVEKMEPVQLWENGPYWATCNVGASSPEEFGYYFWWGDTVGYKRNANDDKWVSVKDGTSFSFSNDDCPTYGKDNSQLQSEGYIDATGNLVAAHDAATAHLGAPWRMPTNDEIQALVDNCTSMWTTRNGVYGQILTGKGACAANSIFLPAAGYGGSSVSYLGSIGQYRSSTPTSGNSNCAWNLYFTARGFDRRDGSRYGGMSVRPVRGFAK